MEGKTFRRLDGVYRLVADPVIRQRVGRTGLFTTVLLVVFGLVTSAALPQFTLGETGSASANRLWSSGAELNTTTADIEVTSTSGTVSINSSTKRSGDYAFRANPTSSTGIFTKIFANSNQSNKFWFRTYVRIADDPSADTYIVRIGNSGGGKISVRLTTSSTLQLRNEEDDANIGSASSALSTNTWYRVEVHVDTTTLSSTDAELRIDGASISSSTAENLASGIDRLTWGSTATGTTDLYFDDIAINDSTGRAADNWPGEGRLVHMQPNADGSNTAWTGDPSDTNDYDDVDEVTPNDSTDFIRSQTNNQLDDNNLESATDAGIGANDVIKLVSLGVRIRPCGNATGGALCIANEVDINWEARVTGGGNTEQSGSIPILDSSGWITNDDDSAKLNKITLYDLPGTSTAPWTVTELDSAQIGVANRDSSGTGFRVSTTWLQVEYVDRSGGRLISSGFELNSATAGMEVSAVTSTPAINSTTFRSGAYALQTENGGGQEYARFYFESANTSGDYYLRAYLNIATAFNNSTATVLSLLDTGNLRRAYLKLTTTSTLELWDEDGQIGSASSALSASTWYRIELRLNTVPAGGSHVVDGRIDGVSFASSSTRNVGTGVARIGLGINASDSIESTSNTQGSLIWDDIALNKGVGATQNTWPGEGSIIHLRPNDDGASTSWTQNGSCAVSNYGCLLEVLPNDGTNYVSETTTDDIDDYNIDNSPLSGSDVVNLVSVGVRFRTSSATQEDFRVRLRDSSTGIAIESNTLSPASTTWTTNATADPKLYPLTAYTRPELSSAWTDTQLDTAQIGLRDVGGSGTVQVTAAWLLVDYTPPSGIVISGTCDQYDQTTDCTDDGSNQIRVAVNGSLQTQVDTTVDGSWAISGVTQPSTGDVITVFIDGESTDNEEAVAVTKYDGTGDITGVVLYQRHLTIGSDDNQTLSNADIDAYDNSVSGDEDIFFDVSAGDDLTVDSLGSYTDEELYIVSGNTYRPASGGGGDVATVHVEIDGTWTADSNAVTVAGSWQNDSVFSSGTGTVTFGSTATGQTLSGTLNGTNGKFYNIVFNGVGGGWTLNAALEVANNFDITNGTFDSNNTSNYAVTIVGNLTGNTGTWSLTMRASTWTVSGNWDTSAIAQDSVSIVEGSSTVIMDGTGTKTITTGSTNTWESRFWNLNVGETNGKTTQMQQSFGVDNVLTLGAGTLDLNSKTLFMVSPPTNPLSLSGTFGTGNGSIYFHGGSATVNLPAYTYNSSLVNSLPNGISLVFQGTTTFTGNLTLSDCCNRANITNLNGQTVTINGNVTFSQSVAVLTMGAANLTVKGNWTNSVAATFNADTSTVDFAATSGTQTIITGGTGSTKQFHNLTHSGASTLSLSTNAVQVANDLSNTGGTMSGSVDVTVNGSVTGVGAITLSGTSTFTQRVAANENFGTTSGASTWTFVNLTFSNSTVFPATAITITTQTGGSGGVNISGILLVGASGDAAGATTTLDAGNRTWTLSGTGGDPFQLLASPAGNLTPSTSTFTFTGNNGAGNTTVQTETYYNLDVNNNSETYVLEGATNADNDLTITNGTLDTTTSNHSMSITRDVLIANTSGAVFRARGSTITVSRNWSKGSSGVFTRDSSTVQLNGTGEIQTVGGGQTQFENLTVAYSTKTTTMATSSTHVFGTLTVNSGTLTCSVTCSFQLFRTSGSDLSINASATLSGSNATFHLRKQSASTVTVTGATNYGTWNILMEADTTGTVTFNVGGAITTSGYIAVRANTGGSGTNLNTQNNDITAKYFQLGDSTDNTAVAANFGSSTMSFDNNTGDAFYVASNGGAHTLNLSTSSTTVEGNVKFVNGTGTITVDDGTSTFTFAPSSGTATYSPDGETLYNVIVNGAATVQPDAAVIIANDLTMTAGTLSGTQNITVNGTVQGTAGIISLTGGTFEQRLLTGGLSKNFGTTSGSTAWTFNDLTFGNGCTICASATVTTQTGGTGGITISGVLRVGKSGDGASMTLSAGNRTWTLSGTGGDPFQLLASPAGNLTASTSTFTYTGNNGGGNTTVQVATYYNLDINNSSETFVLEGNTAAGNDLTVTNGVLDTTGSNFSLTITRDLTLANTAGVGLTGNGSTITVSRNWTDLGSKFTRGTSTVTLNGTGAIDIATGFEFYNLNLAYSTFTTTLPASKTINVENVVTLNGGTLSGSSSTLTPRPRASSKPLVVNSTTTFTGSGFNIISWTGFNAGLTVTVDGDNYSHSSWNLFFAGSTNNTIFQLDAALTASTTVRVYAGGAITGTTFNTANNGMTLQGFRLGSGGATQTTSANFGSSTISLTGTGDTIFPESTGGTYNLDFGTSSVTTTGNVLFVNGSGSITVTEGTSTVTFTPAAAATRTYSPNGQSLYHVIVNGGNDSAQVDLAGNADFNGNLTISGGQLDTVSGSNYAIDVFDVTMSGTATIVANASNITVRGNWTSNATWKSNIGTSTVDLSGTSKAVTTNDANTPGHFYNLTVSGSYTCSADKVNTSNNTNIQGTLTITSPCQSFHNGGTGTTLTIAGTLNGTGIFNVRAATPTYSYSGTIGISNFFYTVNATSTIPAYTYGGNLYLRTDATGNKTYTIGAGTFTISNSFVQENTSTGTLTIDNSVNNATFVINDQFRNLSSSGSYAINLGSSSYSVKGNWMDDDDASWTVGTSTVTLNGTSTQTVSRATGANPFYNLTITNASGASASDCERTGFTASVDFSNDVTVSNNLTFTTANTRVEFDDGNTYTFNNINWNGQAVGTQLYFRNSLTSGSWNLNVSGTQTAVSYINVSRSNASSGNTIVANDGTNVDCGNNVNWNFSNPDAPTDLAQKKTNDTVIATGGWTNETSVKFTATASDTDSSDTLYLCVEKDLLGTGFSNTEDLCGTGVAYTGTPVTVTVTISGITDASEYHWQARVKDQGGLYGSWLSYGGNAESARDFGVDTTACTYAGTVYDGDDFGVDEDFNDGSLEELMANWTSFSCGASGILRYEVSIGTTISGTDILNWTNNGTNTDTTQAGLNLHTNQQYYVNVRAVDNATNTSSVYSSNGQAVLPTISLTLGSTTITFSNLNDGNNRTDSKTLNLTTSTNAYGGYVIRQYATGVLTAGSFTIPMFQGGTYASPGSWPGGFCTGGSNCGYGYTSNDTTIQGSNKFSSGTLYASFATTAFGDIVADHTDAVTGATGPITNQAFTITHKVAVDALQAAKNYQTEVLYIVTGTF